jgi:hypothetical protein
MGQIKCVLFERAPEIARFYRRYSSSTPCPAMPGEYSYHDATVPMDVVPLEGDTIHEQDMPPKDDPLWPKMCDRCKQYAFVDDDRWQVFVDWRFRNTETGEIVNFRNLQVGAMYDCHWYGKDMRGPDGKALVVILPDRTPWCIDGCAHPPGQPPVMPAWTRTGTPPNVSASPSILTPGYHGWLKDGVLTDC